MYGRLEPNDHYWNKWTGCKLPHDSYLDDEENLASLSGPVVIKRMEDLEDENITRRNTLVD